MLYVLDVRSEDEPIPVKLLMLTATLTGKLGRLIHARYLPPNRDFRCSYAKLIFMSCYPPSCKEEEDESETDGAASALV